MPRTPSLYKREIRSIDRKRRIHSGFVYGVASEFAACERRITSIVCFSSSLAPSASIFVILIRHVSQHHDESAKSSAIKSSSNRVFLRVFNSSLPSGFSRVFLGVTLYTFFSLSLFSFLSVFSSVRLIVECLLIRASGGGDFNFRATKRDGENWNIVGRALH